MNLYEYNFYDKEYNRDIRYLVLAESREEADKRIKNVDGKMDASEASCKQLSRFSVYVFEPSNHVTPLAD